MEKRSGLGGHSHGWGIMNVRVMIVADTVHTSVGNGRKHVRGDNLKQLQRKDDANAERKVVAGIVVAGIMEPAGGATIEPATHRTSPM
jgi:hypothetical protein